MNINSISNFTYYNRQNKMPKKANVETSGSIGMTNSYKKNPFENLSFGINPVIVKKYPASTIEGLTRQEKADIDYSIDGVKSCFKLDEEYGGGIDGEVTRAYMQGIFERYSNNMTALKYVLEKGAIEKDAVSAEKTDSKFIKIFLEEFNNADIKEPEKKIILEELLDYNFGKKGSFFKEEDAEAINALLDCIENYSDVLFNCLADKKFDEIYSLVSRKTGEHWEYQNNNFVYYEENVKPYEEIKERLIKDIGFCIDNKELSEEELNALIRSSMPILNDELKKYSPF